MPLEDYLVLHKGAKISKENKKKLVAWLKSIDLTLLKKEESIPLNKLDK